MRSVSVKNESGLFVLNILAVLIVQGILQAAAWQGKINEKDSASQIAEKAGRKEPIMKHITLYDSPVGILRIVTEDSALTDLALDCDEPPVTGEYSREETPLTRRVRSQLDEYFSGQRTDFDLPLKPKGTEFQKKDWAALQEIPYGQTRTYKDIAEAIGCPKGFRAVGLANNRNPIMIIIPCHRVIGSDGSLTGYAGGTHIKKYLLELEGVKVD